MDTVQVCVASGLDTWAQLAQIIIAACSVLLAIIAIFKDHISRWLLPPKLELKEHNLNGDFNVGLTSTGNPIRTIYYHLKVINTRWWSPARTVRVMCEAVSRRTADGASFHMESFVVPMQMSWSFMKYQELLPTIGPERFVDIGFLYENAKEFVISLVAIPGNFKGLVSANETLRFRFVATAENQVKSKPLYIQISWDGQFHFDKEEMSKHLVLSRVDSLGPPADRLR